MISCGSIFACYEFYKSEQRKGRAESFFITFVIFCFKLFCGGMICVDNVTEKVVEGRGKDDVSTSVLPCLDLLPK